MFDNGIVPDYISQLTPEERTEVNKTLFDVFNHRGMGCLRTTSLGSNPSIRRVDPNRIVLRPQKPMKVGANNDHHSQPQST